jgi:putative thioredoxin
VLEREVAALGGRVELVKVDTDANPALGARYRVRSIPAVMAFKDGRVVDEFVGAQGVAYVREFLSRLAPSLHQITLSQALAARGKGDANTAERLARDVLAHDGSARGDVIAEAALLLARILLESGRAGEVEPVLARIDPRSDAVERADSLRALLALATEANAYGGEDKARANLESNPDDLEARYALASALAARGRHIEALDHFLALVTRSRKLKDDGARRAMLAIFDALGSDNEVVRDYRRRLQVVT